MTSGRFQFAVVGSDIQYSLSPRIFSVIFEQTGLDGDFIILDTPVDDFRHSLDQLRRLDGFSVTIPFKTTIMDYVESIDDTAQRIGAVNSVNVTQSRLHGYNTDCIGFSQPLSGLDVRPEKGLVLGTGGAARAVVYALFRLYPGIQVSVCSRQRQRAQHVCDTLAGSIEADGSVVPIGYAEIRRDTTYDIIVNCTPVGSHAYPDKAPLPNDYSFCGAPLCYDLIYSPNTTMLLRAAEKHGCRTINGLPMLIAQAVESFRLWTDKTIDSDALVKTIIRTLNSTEDFCR